MILATAASAFAVTFTEDFENPNWFTGNPAWSYTAVGGSSLDTDAAPFQFTAGDAARLGGDIGGNGSKYGGVSAFNATNLTGPDAPTQAVLDYTMQLAPNTTYTFSIDFESMIFDDNTTTNPGDGRWRNGMQFHIGNSAQMDLGTQFGGGGPWTGDGGGGNGRVGSQFHAVWGKSWDDTAQAAQTDPWLEHGIGNLGNIDWRGVWHNPGGSGLPTTFTTRGNRDGAAADVNTYAPGDYAGNGVSTQITTGADGLVIFRTGLRLKSQTATQVSFVLDNLSITLTPEPASAFVMLMGGGLMLLRRRRRTV
jgi:hypothetical protein